MRNVEHISDSSSTCTRPPPCGVLVTYAHTAIISKIDKQKNNKKERT